MQGFHFYFENYSGRDVSVDKYYYFDSFTSCSHNTQESEYFAQHDLHHSFANSASSLRAKNLDLVMTTVFTVTLLG